MLRGVAFFLAVCAVVLVASEEFDCDTSCQVNVGKLVINFLEVEMADTAERPNLEWLENAKELREKCWHCRKEKAAAMSTLHRMLAMNPTGKAEGEKEEEKYVPSVRRRSLALATTTTTNSTLNGFVLEDSDSDSDMNSIGADETMAMGADNPRRPIFGVGCSQGDGSSGATGVQVVTYPNDMLLLPTPFGLGSTSQPGTFAESPIQPVVTTNLTHNLPEFTPALTGVVAPDTAPLTFPLNTVLPLGGSSVFGAPPIVFSLSGSGGSGVSSASAAPQLDALGNVVLPLSPEVSALIPPPAKPSGPQPGVPDRPNVATAGPGVDDPELAILAPPDSFDPFDVSQPVRVFYVPPPLPRPAVLSEPPHPIRAEPLPSPTPEPTLDAAWLGEAEPLVPETPCQVPISLPDSVNMPDTSPPVSNSPPRIPKVQPLPTGGEWTPPLPVSEQSLDRSDGMNHLQVFGMLHSTLSTYNVIMDRSASMGEINTPTVVASTMADEILTQPGIATPDVPGVTETELNARASWALMNTANYHKLNEPISRTAFIHEVHQQSTELTTDEKQTVQGLRPQIVPPPPLPPPQVQLPLVSNIAISVSQSPAAAVAANVTDTSGMSNASTVGAPVLNSTAAVLESEPVGTEPAVAVDTSNNLSVDMQMVQMPPVADNSTHDPPVRVDMEDELGTPGTMQNNFLHTLSVQQPVGLSSNLRHADGPLVRPRGVWVPQMPGYMMTEVSPQTMLGNMPDQSGCASTGSNVNLQKSVSGPVDEAAPMLLPDEPCQQRNGCDDCVTSALCVWCPTLNICTLGGLQGAVSRQNCYVYAFGTCDSTQRNPLLPRAQYQTKLSQVTDMML